MEVDNTRKNTQQEHSQLLEENHQLHEELDAKAKEIEELLMTQEELVEVITTLEAGQVKAGIKKDRKSVVKGKSVSDVSITVDEGTLKKKKRKTRKRKKRQI